MAAGIQFHILRKQSETRLCRLKADFTYPLRRNNFKTKSIIIQKQAVTKV